MKINTAVVLMAGLAVLACAATAQQDVQTPQTEHQGMQMPMGRPEPAPQMMPETPQKPAPEMQEHGAGQGGGMAGPCPVCQMGHGQDQSKAMQMRMKQAGVPDETVARAGMLMRARIHPADPQGLLALQQELNLTEDQVAQLDAIIDSAQEQALGVLKPEQWAKVKQLRPRAASMMDMHRTIMPMMRNAMGEGRGGMMGNMMPEGQQAPYGRPESGGAQQQPSGCSAKPEFK